MPRSRNPTLAQTAWLDGITDQFSVIYRISLNEEGTSITLSGASVVIPDAPWGRTPVAKEMTFHCATPELARAAFERMVRHLAIEEMG